MGPWVVIGCGVWVDDESEGRGAGGAKGGVLRWKPLVRLWGRANGDGSSSDDLVGV